MRQKRAKSYRKQLAYLQLNFKFREPYQILIDAQMIMDAVRTKLDLEKALERTVQGKIKPMVTQCTMEALYKDGNQTAIDLAKSFERRKCGHIPRAVAETNKTAQKEKKQEEAEEKQEQDSDSKEEEDNDKKKSDTKSKKKSKKTKDDEEENNYTKTPSACMWTVVAVDKTVNKNRYVVASQDFRLRSRLRTIPAVPLLYLNRSVMVLEPMSEATTKARNEIETAKLMRGLNPEHQAIVLGKRKADSELEKDNGNAGTSAVNKRKKAKGPHPLSVLKKKKKTTAKPQNDESQDAENGEKKKRRRKHHGKKGGAESESSNATAIEAN